MSDWNAYVAFMRELRQMNKWKGDKPDIPGDAHKGGQSRAEVQSDAFIDHQEDKET